VFVRFCVKIGLNCLKSENCLKTVLRLSVNLGPDLFVKKHSVDRTPRKDRSSLTDVFLSHPREKNNATTCELINSIISVVNTSVTEGWRVAEGGPHRELIVLRLNLQRTLEKRRWQAERVGVVTTR